MLAMVQRESGAVVGFAGLVPPGGQPEAEIKYALHRSHWGKGFATEAAAALLAYGASQFGLAENIATTAPENKASHRVLLKAGTSSTRELPSTTSVRNAASIRIINEGQIQASTGTTLGVWKE
jgi:RimJ/RimL family protein N-acetyltransferase